jgi:hypothetical protein
MEVHHHPQLEHMPKPWKEYFLEFLMIFLAVTMGFFAESLREYITDKERATEQAHSFYAELKSDSAAAASALKNWDRKNQALFYIKRYFEADSSLTNCPKLFSLNFYYAFRIISPSRFEPKTVILEQLKNSGSLRYLKSREVQRLTGEVSAAIANVRLRNEVENHYLDTYISQFVIKHNDPMWFDLVNPNDDQVFTALAKYEKSTLVVPFHLNNPAGFNRNESLNMIGDFQMVLSATRTIVYKRYQVWNHTLLEALRKEYDIE